MSAKEFMDAMKSANDNLLEMIRERLIQVEEINDLLEQQNRLLEKRVVALEHTLQQTQRIMENRIKEFTDLGGKL